MQALNLETLIIMEKLVLKVEQRDSSVPAYKAREAGFIPAVCYGAGKENLHVNVPYQEFRRIYKLAGENTVVDLVLGSETHKVLIHDLQMDPVYTTVLHVDFHIVNMKEKVDTHVPVVLVGESPAVKQLSGVINQSLDEVEVRCLPGDIPHEFIVDISVIEDFHKVIHVSDLVIPKGVELLTDLELPIVSVLHAGGSDSDTPELSPEEAEKAAILAAGGSVE